MLLSQQVQQFLLNEEIPEGVDMNDVLEDAHELLIDLLLDECSQYIHNPQDIESLDEIIGEATLNEIEQFFAVRVSDFEDVKETVFQKFQDVVRSGRDFD